jgi:hypothetical protein
MNGFRESKRNRPTFEDSCPMYDLTPLVAIVLALGGWLAGLRRRRIEHAPRAIAQESEAPGQAHPT